MKTEITLSEFLSNPRKFANETFLILRDYKPDTYCDKVWYTRIPQVPRQIYENMENWIFKCMGTVDFDSVEQAEKEMSRALQKYARFNRTNY